MKSPYKKECKLLTDFYMWMVENGHDHNIRIRVETKAELFLRSKASNDGKRFWLSIKKSKHCLFSRRNGYKGKIILGFSIRLRLFNSDLI